LTAELTFTELLLVLTGTAVGVGLLVALFVYAGGSRGRKRYRPGRPFEFTPVWFLSAPERQSRAGLVTSDTLGALPVGPGGERSGTVRPGTERSGTVRPGAELVAASSRRVGPPMQTGGASDSW
jgi:hypothetical protein